MPSTERYLYAFVTEPVEAPLREGIGGNPIFFIEGPTIDGTTVYAAVSGAPKGRVRAQRKHLSAHQRVVSALAGRITTLPAAFGLVAEEDAIRSLLDFHAGPIIDTIASVGGCVEMTLCVKWDNPDAFGVLVELDDELRALRDELVEHGDAAPHDLRVAVGRRVETVLGSIRTDHAGVAFAAVGPTCRDIQDDDALDASELVKLHCLVERGGVEAFEAAIGELAEELDDSYVIAVSGPFAPHHFVNLELDFSAFASEPEDASAAAS
ncbi:MAG: GvpL/GvpF family gas vesicle protein [Planctomycetota bacterium]